jgi:hypothetical protein
MTNTSRLKTSVASFAVLMAIVAFVLGSAPFTPALALAVVAIPVALATFLLGVRRLSSIALYWASAALLSVTGAQWLQVRVDYMLLVLGILGIGLSVLFYLQYMHVRSAT